MNQIDTQAEAFSQYRPLLFSIAYRMLGSAMDAEDIVQETFLRWQQSTDPINSPKSYLTAITTRLCIDYLRSARVQRESYIGPWLPEPILESTGETASMLADSLSTAFLLVLENLSPHERAAFLLREVFDYDYDEIAHILDKSPSNCRQMVKRAKDHLAAHRPRYAVSPQQQQAILARFLQVCATGDVEGLLALLTDDVVEMSDGGGKVSSALNPIYGPDKVARLILGLLKRALASTEIRVAPINGRLGVITYAEGQIYSALTFDIDGDRIRRVFFVRNPDKLKHLPATPSEN